MTRAPSEAVIEAVERAEREHQAGVHRLIRHYRRTDVPVVVGVAS